MEECLTRDREAAGSSLTGVTVLCPCARHINPSLVLVQLMKTRPYITERLLMGRKESNQTKQTNKQTKGLFSISLKCPLFAAQTSVFSAHLSSQSAQCPLPASYKTNHGL